MFYNSAYLIKGLYVNLSSEIMLNSAKFSQIDPLPLKNIDKSLLGTAALDGIRTVKEKPGELKALYKV